MEIQLRFDFGPSFDDSDDMSVEDEDEVMRRLRLQMQPRIDALRASERITEEDLKLIVY